MIDNGLDNQIKGKDKDEEQGALPADEIQPQKDARQEAINQRPQATRPVAPQDIAKDKVPLAGGLDGQDSKTHKGRGQEDLSGGSIGQA